MVALSGGLYDGRDTLLASGVYRLTVSASDGTTTSDATRRSGVAEITVTVDGDVVGDAVQTVAGDSQPLSYSVDVDFNDLEGGPHAVAVTTVDNASNANVSEFTVRTACCLRAERIWGTVDLTGDVRFADVTGDQRADVVGRDSIGGLTVSTSDGSRFSSATRWGASAGVLNDLATGDLDGDGRDDVLVRNQVTGQLLFARSTGAAFASAVDEGTWPTDLSVVLADFDGDGADDLLGQRSSGEVVLAYYRGGRFVGTHSLGAVGAGKDLLAGDIDGDAAADLILRDRTSGAVSVAKSQGYYVDAPISWAAPPAGASIVAGDIDGDGDDDLVVRAASSDQVSAFLSASDSSQRLDLGTWTSAWSLELADVDGDAKSDVVGVEPASGLDLARNVHAAISMTPTPKESDDDPDTSSSQSASSASPLLRSEFDAVGSAGPAAASGGTVLVSQDDRTLVYGETYELTELETSGFVAPDPATVLQRQLAIQDRLWEAGVRVLRFNIYWGLVRKQDNADGTQRFDLGPFKDAIIRARDRGFGVYVTLSGAAQKSYECRDRPGSNWPYRSWGCDHTPTGYDPDPAKFAEFVRAAAAELSTIPPRTASDGAVLNERNVSAFSIWNEPNLGDKVGALHTFLTVPNLKLGIESFDNALTAADRYGELYAAGYDAVKSVNPSLQVLLGELTAKSEASLRPDFSTLRLAPKQWLERALTAARAKLPTKWLVGGTAVPADGFALHPYQHGRAPWQREAPGTWGIGRLKDVTNELACLRTAASGCSSTRLQTSSGAAVPLYLTEFAYLNWPRKNTSDNWPKWHTEKERSQWLYGEWRAGKPITDRSKAGAVLGKRYGALDRARLAGAPWMLYYGPVELTYPNTTDLRQAQDGGILRYDGAVTGVREYGKRAGAYDPTPGQPGPTVEPVIRQSRSAYCEIWLWAKKQGTAVRSDSPCATAKIPFRG